MSNVIFPQGEFEIKEIHQAGLPGNVIAIIDYRRVDDSSFYLSLTPDTQKVLKEAGII